jgi:hypothetical protein
MTLPANIRVNLTAPFPALVQGIGPISVAKANGIWTIGLGVTQLIVQVPPAGNFPTDYLLVWDSVAKTFFTASLSSLISGNRVQRSITTGPVVVTSTDQILNLNLGSSLVITLPHFALRSGLPITFKDVGRQATAFPQTIAAAAGETIDSLASIPLNTNAQSITLMPANDSVNTGWFQV